MSNHRSFTLIELLVVIAIIGVLSAIVITSISGAVTKSRIVRLQVFSDTIRAQLSDSLVSYWSFNEGTGVTAYDQWEGNNGTLTNFNFDSTDGWRSGGDCVSGKCLDFDGDNDYVNCGSGVSLNITNTMTIEIWVSTTQEEAGPAVYARPTLVGVQHGGGYTTNDFTLGVRNGDLNWWDEFTGAYQGDYNTGCFISDGSWHHIIATRTMGESESTMLFYSDGELVGSFVTGTGSIERPIRVGAGYTSSEFDGLIDEVRIYNSAASITQIQSQYLVGLNNLLSNGAISKSEYNQRIKELSKYLVNE